VLCPSFYRADIVRNARGWELRLDALRRRFIGWLGGAAPIAEPAE
jgi:indolepyruvate ferredoxin oxidoreductase alpha subunit